MNIGMMMTITHHPPFHPNIYRVIVSAILAAVVSKGIIQRTQG